MSTAKGESNKITGLVHVSSSAANVRDTFTTGAVAKICRVAPRTVSKWIDSGRIPGAYKIPGSLDRRIPRDSLIQFLKENDMPMRELGPKVFLLVATDSDLTSRIESALPEGWRLAQASSLLPAGRRVAEESPTVILFDCDAIGRAAAREAAKSFSEPGTPLAPRLVAIATLEDGATEADFLSAGFDVCRGKAAGGLDVGELVAGVTGGNGKVNGNGRKRE